MHLVTSANELSVDVFHVSDDGVFDGFRDLELDKTSSKGFKDLVKDVLFRVTDGKFKRLKLDVDILHLEDVAVREQNRLALINRKSGITSEGEREQTRRLRRLHERSCNEEWWGKKVQWMV